MNRTEILLQVKNAEQEAQRILDEAREKQKAIISAARREALKRVQEAEEKLREEFSDALTAERDRVAALREELLKKGRAEAAEIERRVRERIKQAKVHLKSLFERTIDAAA